MIDVIIYEVGKMILKLHHKGVDFLEVHKVVCVLQPYKRTQNPVPLVRTLLIY